MLQKQFKSEFSKNVLVLLTGTGIAQLIPLLLMPVLSRLFTPEEFGVFAFYFSIVTFLSIFATGRYDLAILLPKEKKDAINILGLSFLILSVFTIIISLIGFLLSGFLFSFPRLVQLGNWLWSIPILVFLLAGINILTAWNNRNKRFSRTSFSKVLMYAGDAVSGAYIGSLKNNIQYSSEGIKELFHPDHVITTSKSWSFHGLILSKFIGLFSSFSYLTFSFLKKDRSELQNISTSHIKQMAVEHKDFPKINMLHALTDELKTSGLSFVILAFFMERTLGIYNMTYKILRSPLAIIGNSFSQVFFQKAAEQYSNKEKILPFVKSTTRKLFIIGLPIFLVIFLFAPPIFTFILGEKWSDAGIYAQYLTPWLFVNFIISPISQVAIILKKQFAFWMINLFSNVLIFLSILWAGAVAGDIKIGFIIISVTQVIFYIWVYLWLTKTIRIAEESY